MMDDGWWMMDETRGRGGWEVQKGGNICLHIADSPHYTAETNTYCKATVPQLKNKVNITYYFKHVYNYHQMAQIT